MSNLNCWNYIAVTLIFVCKYCFRLQQALGLKRDDTFSVTMLGHCIEMYIGDTDAYIGLFDLKYPKEEILLYEIIL